MRLYRLLGAAPSGGYVRMTGDLQGAEGDLFVDDAGVVRWVSREAQAHELVGLEGWQPGLGYMVYDMGEPFRRSAPRTESEPEQPSAP